MVLYNGSIMLFQHLQSESARVKCKLFGT